jgi:hypothetical protein
LRSSKNLVEQVAAAKRDVHAATRALCVLRDTLLLTKEHLRFVMPDDWKESVEGVTLRPSVT